jgi:hypothetical protein
LLSFARSVLLLIGRGKGCFFLDGFGIGIGGALGGWIGGLGRLRIRLFPHAGILCLPVILNKPSLFLLGVVSTRGGTALCGRLDSSSNRLWLLNGLLLLCFEDGLDICRSLHLDILDAFLFFLFGVYAFGFEG